MFKKDVVPCALLALFVCVLGVGCADSDLGQVTGTIHLDGQPLEGAMVTFYPIASESVVKSGDRGGASYGRTDANGEYELIYSRTKDGAEIGEHKVVITTLEESGGGDYGPGTPERLPKKYNVETTLTAEVKPGRNVIDFLDLNSEGEKQQARGARY